ncbi:MAG: ATP synthase F1 subunit epsilon [Elusimicrobia bacterium]|nr:ATP synthase F1 subunit epsilon [Elusimicrobiota bacterium]
MKIFSLEIISPEGSIYKDIVSEVILPTTTGEIAVLPGHAPLFTKLSDGEILVKKEKQSISIAISGGFLEISENKVNVLANYAVRSEEIEMQKIAEAKAKAEEALKQTKDKEGLIAAEKDLKKYAMELKIAERLKKRRKKNI